MVVFWSFFGPPWGPLKNPQKPPKTPKNTPFFGSDGWGTVKSQNRRFWQKMSDMGSFQILGVPPKIAKNCPFWAPSGAILRGLKNDPKTTFFTNFDEPKKSIFMRLTTWTLTSSTQTM